MMDILHDFTNQNVYQKPKDYGNVVYMMSFRTCIINSMDGRARLDVDIPGPLKGLTEIAAMCLLG